MPDKKYQYVLLISIILFIINQANASILNIAVNDLDGKPAGGVVFQIFKGEISIDDNALPIILGDVKDGMDNDGDGQIDEPSEDLLGYATFPNGKLQLNLPDGLYTLVGFSQAKHFLFVTKVSVPSSVTINATDAVPVNISCRASDGSAIKTAEVFFRPTKRSRASIGYSDNNGQIKAYISPGEYNIVLWAVSGQGPHYLVLPNFVVSKPEKSVAIHVADMPTTVLRFELPKNYAVAMFEVLESTYTIEYSEGLEPEVGYDVAYTDFYFSITEKIPFTLSANVNYNFNMSFALTFGKGLIYAYEIRPSVHLLTPGEMRVGTTETEKFSLHIATDQSAVSPIYHPGDNIKLFYHFIDGKGNTLSRILNYTGARNVFPMVTIWDPNGTPIANNIGSFIFDEFEFTLPKSSIAGDYKAEISLDAGLYGIIEGNLAFRVQPIVDNEPPIIELGTIPEQIEAGEQIKVSAKITDKLSEIKASPIFRISNDYGNSWIDFQMLSSDKKNYQTNLPSSIVLFGNMDWQIIAEDSSGNKKTISGIINVVDTAKPIIKHDIISKAELGLDLQINAEITDNSAIKEAMLFYILPNNQTKSIIMSKTSQSQYSALIDRHDVVDGIIYYISVADLAENRTFMPSELDSPKPAKISVQDTLPPLIDHNPIKLAIAEVPLIIEAIITDNSNYVEAILYYKNEINSNYKSVKMNNQGGFHFAEIPIDDVIIGKLNYHISAQDLPDQSGKTRSSQSPTTGDYSIDVISALKGDLADIEIFPISSSTNPIIIGAGDRLKFSAIGKTDSNDPIPVDVFWVSTDGVGYISQDGSFLAAGKIIGDGKGKVIATSINNNIAQAEAWVQIVPKQPSYIKLNPSSVIAIAGDQMTFSASITDIYNNSIQAEIKWRLDSSDGIGDITTTKENQCILAFRKTGRGKLIAEYNELSAISDITVISSKLSRITIAEINNAKSPFVIKAGNSLQFVASGFDSFGNKVRILPSWSVIGNIGKIDSDGKFIGGIAGKGKIMATVANISALLDIEVTTGELAYVSVSPYTAYIPVTTSKYKSTQQFTAIGRDVAGNIVQLKSVSWSTDESAGTITKDGLFTAITDPGVRIGEVITNGTIYANGVSPTGKVIQGTGYIVIQRLPTSFLTSVRVFIQGTSGSSPKISTATGKSIQFEATGNDIAGRDISINPTWSVIGGIGNIDVNGKFTATKSGSGFVIATAGGYNGQIAVDVTTGSLNSIKIKPDFLYLTSGKQSISVIGYDLYENIVPIDNVKWSSDNNSIKITPKGNSCEVELISNPQESSGIISAVVGDLIAYANIFMPISDVKINTEDSISSSNNPYYF
ncbi:TPA: hypothetical protein ENS27_11395, partial [bacterium]|nr:hypothetical protein [bacterium]